MNHSPCVPFKSFWSYVLNIQGNYLKTIKIYNFKYASRSDMTSNPRNHQNLFEISFKFVS